MAAVFSRKLKRLRSTYCTNSFAFCNFTTVLHHVYSNLPHWHLKNPPSSPGTMHRRAVTWPQVSWHVSLLHAHRKRRRHPLTIFWVSLTTSNAENCWNFQCLIQFLADNIIEPRCWMLCLKGCWLYWPWFDKMWTEHVYNAPERCTVDWLFFFSAWLQHFCVKQHTAPWRLASITRSSESSHLIRKVRQLSYYM